MTLRESSNVKGCDKNVDLCIGYESAYLQQAKVPRPRLGLSKESKAGSHKFDSLETCLVNENNVITLKNWK